MVRPENRAAIRGIVASLSGLFLTFAAGGPAHASALGPTERAVLTSFNVCWTAEEGGNLAGLASDAGFAPPPQATGPLYYRDVQGSVIFLSADFGPGADGRPEPACRVTVLKPQINTPYAPRGAILPAARDLIDRMVQEGPNMGPGYRLVTYRQPHPRRAGRTRTLLRADQGTRSRMIYIEEGARDYEFLYVNGSRALIDDPATADIGTDPRGRTSI